MTLRLLDLTPIEKEKVLELRKLNSEYNKKKNKYEAIYFKAL